MCGIVGLFPYTLKNECDLVNNVAKSVIHRMLFSETLVALEPRGKDSSGIALLWNDSKTAVLKQPIPSPIFVRDEGTWNDHIDPDHPSVNFKWLMSLWNRGVNTDHYLRAAFGHVRKGTVGSPYDNHNNHPIIVPPSGKLKKDDLLPEGTVIGIHNGGIQNADKLFKDNKLERIGEVDSEIIFQLMSKYKDDMSIDNLSETFNDLEGAYAVMAYNNAIPNKIGCLREVRPMEAAYFPALGTLMVVSERKYLDEAWDIYDKWRVREADMDLSFTNESGETENVGKIGDLFPFVDYSWYGKAKQTYNAASSVEAGVFILDLDTEVNDKTKPEDLIKVTKITKKASTDFTGGAYGGHRSTSGKTNTTDKRSATAKPATTTSDANKKLETEVVDTTNYDKKEDIIDVEAEEVESDTTTEGETFDVELSEINDCEEEEEEFPYAWDELKKMGKKALYQQQHQEDERLLINKSMKEILRNLDNYLIRNKDENTAASTLACMYDLLWPEAWASGHLAGYGQAGLEYETLSEGEEEDTSLSDKLQAALAAMGVLKEKKDRATRLLSVFGPMLSMFLSNEDVLKDDGTVNMVALERLMKKANVNNPDKWGLQVAKALAQKKKV